MDFLLAGKRFSLQKQGLLPDVDVQRRYLWKTFRGKPNSVPGLAKKCSSSPRNRVRVAPEYALHHIEQGIFEFRLTGEVIWEFGVAKLNNGLVLPLT